MMTHCQAESYTQNETVDWKLPLMTCGNTSSSLSSREFAHLEADMNALLKLCGYGDALN